MSVVQSIVLNLLLRYSIAIDSKGIAKDRAYIIKAFIFSSILYVFLWIISEVLEGISAVFGNVCIRRIHIH